MNVLGQPWVRMSGTPPRLTCTKWIPSATKCSYWFSRRSCSRQSNPSAQYASSPRRYSSSVPCAQPGSGEAGGQRVARIRSRRSASVASGSSIRNGLTASRRRGRGPAP